MCNTVHVTENFAVEDGISSAGCDCALRMEWVIFSQPQFAFIAAGKRILHCKAFNATR